MQRHAAEFECGSALRPEWLEQLAHIKEQWVEPAEFVPARDDRLDRRANRGLRHAPMAYEDIDDRYLRRIGVETADGALAHHGATIIRHRLHDLFQLVPLVGQDA